MFFNGSGRGFIICLESSTSVILGQEADVINLLTATFKCSTRRKLSATHCLVLGIAGADLALEPRGSPRPGLAGGE